MDYKVTIGIPVYNVERYIRQTLDAALAQTFTDIEFLICDDCGTDNSIAIVRQYQQEHPRGQHLRIVRQPENRGIGEGRNRMMAEAQGRYFYSLDADDTISPDAIELLYNAALRHQAEIVYGSHERVTVNDNSSYTEQLVYPAKVFTRPDEYAQYVYDTGIQVMNWNYLIDLNVVRRNHLQVTPVRHGYGEDYTYTVDLPTYITRAVLLPNITYRYQIDASAVTAKREKVMDRQQMDLALAAIDQKKRRTELSHKPYYARRCAKLLMYDFYFAHEMILHQGTMKHPYTNTEIRNTLWHPMSLWQILRSPQARGHNLGAWVLGHLSPSLAVMLIKRLGQQMKK